MSKTICEIKGQYKALSETVKLITAQQTLIKQFYESVNPDSFIAVGCGSSFQLCESIALTARLRLNVSSVAIPGGDLMIHTDEYSALFEGRPLLLTISRSGSTSEVLYSITQLKEKYPQLKVVCITCKENSEIAAISDYVIEIPWAFDESVCQTRSVTNLYASSIMFIGASVDSVEEIEAFSAATEKGDLFLEKNEELLRSIGNKDFSSVAILCDGESFGVAEEAALAFNEIAYTPSVFKHVLDVRHGPIVLFNNKTLVIMKLTPKGLELCQALISDIRNRGAEVLVISDDTLPYLDGANYQLSFGCKLPANVSGIILLPIAQLISYYHALKIGADPDNPIGLDAWIKL